jgi:hypothetical protein
MNRVGLLELIVPFFCLAVIVAAIMGLVILLVIRHANRKSR